MHLTLTSTPELEIAKEAARAGGAVVAAGFGQAVTFREKGASDLVSDVDTASERIIVDVIRRAFPHHAVLAEEAHRDDVHSEHLWIVDPLDGTTNFAHGIPHVAVSIAYWRGGRAECGVIFNPLRQEWYCAVRGEGAYLQDRRVAVSPARGLDESLIGVGFYYDRSTMMEATLTAIRDLFRRSIHGIRRFGTASLDLCQVGTGAFGAFFEYELKPWDFAAGTLFVQEAGGRVTTCRGEELPLAAGSVLASNGHLHPALLEIVAAHMPKSPGLL